MLSMNLPRLQSNLNYFNSLNRIKIPQFVLQNLYFISPELAQELEFISAQKKYDLQRNYRTIYDQFFSDDMRINLSSALKRTKAELLKELASIESRKKFIRQIGNKEEYFLLIQDAKAHSSKEYQLKVELQLQEIDEFLFAIYANFKLNS